MNNKIFKFLKKELNEEDYLYVEKYSDPIAKDFDTLFEWRDTPQGSEFWNKLNNKYSSTILYSNLLKWLKKELTKKDYEYVLKKGNKSHSIVDLFSWSDTPQGHDFWNNLDTKYMMEE